MSQRTTTITARKGKGKAGPPGDDGPPRRPGKGDPMGHRTGGGRVQKKGRAQNRLTRNDVRIRDPNVASTDPVQQEVNMYIAVGHHRPPRYAQATAGVITALVHASRRDRRQHITIFYYNRDEELGTHHIAVNPAEYARIDQLMRRSDFAAQARERAEQAMGEYRQAQQQLQQAQQHAQQAQQQAQQAAEQVQRASSAASDAMESIDEETRRESSEDTQKTVSSAEEQRRLARATRFGGSRDYGGGRDYGGSRY